MPAAKRPRPVRRESQYRVRFQAVGPLYGIALQTLMEMWGFQQKMTVAIDLILHEAREIHRFLT
jgi:hypothetical protein